MWLYALVSTRDTRRTRVARQVVEAPDVIISAQVINEICVNLLRKVHLPETDIAGIITDLYRTRIVVPTDLELLLCASTLRCQYHFSFWDSLIVAAALQSHAERLYTEDMQHGMVIRGQLQIINPFMSLASDQRPSKKHKRGFPPANDKH